MALILRLFLFLDVFIELVDFGAAGFLDLLALNFLLFERFFGFFDQ